MNTFNFSRKISKSGHKTRFRVVIREKNGIMWEKFPN